MSTLNTNNIELVNKIATVIRNRGKTATSALAFARDTLASGDKTRAAADAMNALKSEFDALDKDKKSASSLMLAIRAVYKDHSTAMSFERKALQKEFNDETAEKAALYARYPYRIVVTKSVYCVVTHAEFDAMTRNRRAERKMDKGDAGDANTSDADAAPAAPDKAAQAIAALETALANMTVDRDAWKERAILAESIVADLNKPVKAKPANQAKGKGKKAA